MGKDFVLPESLQSAGRELLDTLDALLLDAPLVLNTPERMALHEAAVNDFRLDSGRAPCTTREVAAVIDAQFGKVALAEPEALETFLDAPDLAAQMHSFLAEAQQAWQQHCTRHW